MSLLAGTYSSSGLTLTVLIRVFVPSFIVTHYAMFGWYSWEVCPFQKGNGEVDLRERGGEERTGRSGDWRNYRWKIMYGRKIIFSKKKRKKFVMENEFIYI